MNISKFAVLVCLILNLTNCSQEMVVNTNTNKETVTKLTNVKEYQKTILKNRVEGLSSVLKYAYPMIWYDPIVEVRIKMADSLINSVDLTLEKENFESGMKKTFVAFNWLYHASSYYAFVATYTMTGMTIDDYQNILYHEDEHTKNVTFQTLNEAVNKDMYSKAMYFYVNRDTITAKTLLGTYYGKLYQDSILASKGCCEENIYLAGQFIYYIPFNFGVITNTSIVMGLDVMPKNEVRKIYDENIKISLTADSLMNNQLPLMKHKPGGDKMVEDCMNLDIKEYYRVYAEVSACEKKLCEHLSNILKKIKDE